MSILHLELNSEQTHILKAGGFRINIKYPNSAMIGFDRFGEPSVHPCLVTHQNRELPVQGLVVIEKMALGLPTLPLQVTMYEGEMRFFSLS